MSDNQTTSPRDCRLIQGDEPVIISRTTAIEALSAMEVRANEGAYRMLFADDASFVSAAMGELRKASGA